MLNFVFKRFKTEWVLFGLMFLFLVSPLRAQKKEVPPREQIGEVLGKPVYRDEIPEGAKVNLQHELHRLFAAPATQKYYMKHRAEIDPTELEIALVAAHFSKDKDIRELDKENGPLARKELQHVKKQLANSGLTPKERLNLENKQTELQAELVMPGRSFARFILEKWKFQRYLYDKYGGGRILWQQAGLEAFDAMHNWLKDLEKKGEFRIDDPKLRAEFYDYWTREHSFLINKKEDIRKEFLEPEWAPKLPAKK